MIEFNFRLNEIFLLGNSLLFSLLHLFFSFSWTSSWASCFLILFLSFLDFSSLWLRISSRWSSKQWTDSFLKTFHHFRHSLIFCLNLLGFLSRRIDWFILSRLTGPTSSKKNIYQFLLIPFSILKQITNLVCHVVELSWALFKICCQSACWPWLWIRTCRVSSSWIILHILD